MFKDPDFLRCLSVKSFFISDDFQCNMLVHLMIVRFKYLIGLEKRGYQERRLDLWQIGTEKQFCIEIHKKLETKAPYLSKTSFPNNFQHFVAIGNLIMGHRYV